MTKPKILIADPDINYIIPFQAKFAEDFFEKVNLEIITDQLYFSTMFSVTQRADILIICEAWYSQAIQRHNISHIFVMKEQYDEDQPADLGIHHIFKYTSIKEIFTEIIGKSAEVLSIANETSHEPQIILFSSACGGTGKTTLAIGVCNCLARNCKRVLYMNADRLQAFQHFLENPTPISATDVYAKLALAASNTYREIKHVIRNETFSYLPAFKASLSSVGLHYDVFERIAISAKQSNDYDYIIIDADSTLDDEKSRLHSLADKVVIVTQQNRNSVYATNLLFANITGITPEKYIIVCNKFDKNQDNLIVSPHIALHFSINEYVGYFEHYDRMKCTDFAKNKDIQRVAHLVM